MARVFLTWGCTNGPFIKAVVEMGWPGIAVLRQGRYGIYRETLALSQGQPPTAIVERDGRNVSFAFVRESDAVL